ncbi:MAG: hypothetical protein GY795_23805 [Desulfobacterales bacterium]|nr:hypothetical protein [Desulfobacterales bacterium]
MISEKKQTGFLASIKPIKKKNSDKDYAVIIHPPYSEIVYLFFPTAYFLYALFFISCFVPAAAVILLVIYCLFWLIFIAVSRMYRTYFIIKNHHLFLKQKKTISILKENRILSEYPLDSVRCFLIVIANKDSKAELFILDNNGETIRIYDDELKISNRSWKAFGRKLEKISGVKVKHVKSVEEVRTARFENFADIFK